MNDVTDAVIKRANDFILKNKLCVISTVSPAGKPEAAVCIYLPDENFDFYFITRGQTRKTENLKTNKNVAVVIGTEPAPFTIQAEGEAQFLLSTESEEFMNKVKGREDLQALYFGPFLKMPGTDFAIFKIKTNWLRYMEIDPETGEEVYYQIIPAENKI